MTGARTDRTRWLRDQILAAVREHPGSTTQELVDAMARHSSTARAYDGRPYLDGVTYSSVYSHLRGLDRLNLVRWQSWTQTRDLVRWWPIAAPDDDLETIASLPTVEPTRGERP